MKIRSKVILYASVFALASGGVMEWCYRNIRREEAAFLTGRRAMKTLAAVTDIEYFLVRQVRLLENYVLLGDESERLQLVQAGGQMRQRLKEWDEAVDHGEAHGDELPVIRSLQKSIGMPANKIRSLISKGKRIQAMALVEEEFFPVSSEALKTFNEVKSRVETAKVESEMLLLEELHRNHLGLMAGLGLIVFFGLTFLLALYRAVIQPIQKMRVWADRVARGEKGIAIGSFAGKNELTELARSIGEMAIQLTRPRSAVPPPPLSEVSTAAVVTPPAPETSTIPQAPPPAPLETFVPVAVPPPPAPAPKDDFDESVDEFREILTQLAGKETSKNRRNV